jgi:endonuclease YncB( thermonuclease family)
VAELFLADGRSVNVEMVRAGMALPLCEVFGELCGEGRDRASGG